MPFYQSAILAAGWIAWLAPFFLAGRRATPARKVDPRARWGMLLVAAGLGLLWQNRFWEKAVPGWRCALSIGFLGGAILLAWTAPRALGRHWRLDAGLSSDHELITTGPYRVVRHPIYTSLLCAQLGTGLMITPLPQLALALAASIMGTEIRVRIEERLLASQFGDRFQDYQRRVPAYIPFLK